MFNIVHIVIISLEHSSYITDKGWARMGVFGLRSVIPWVGQWVAEYVQASEILWSVVHAHLPSWPGNSSCSADRIWAPVGHGHQSTIRPLILHSG